MDWNPIDFPFLLGGGLGWGRGVPNRGSTGRAIRLYLLLKYFQFQLIILDKTTKATNIMKQPVHRNNLLYISYENTLQNYMNLIYLLISLEISHKCETSAFLPFVVSDCPSCTKQFVYIALYLDFFSKNIASACQKGTYKFTCVWSYITKMVWLSSYSYGAILGIDLAQF